MQTFHSLELDQLDFRKTLERLRSGIAELTFEGTASIPEADVLRCKFKGKRFNIKFDLVYGVSIDAIDALSKHDFREVLIILT